MGGLVWLDIHKRVLRRPQDIFLRLFGSRPYPADLSPVPAIPAVRGLFDTTNVEIIPGLWYRSL